MLLSRVVRANGVDLQLSELALMHADPCVVGLFVVISVALNPFLVLKKQRIYKESRRRR